MEKGLGDLGFWVGLGIVIAAMIVSGALKERDKEREKQATLRTLLEKPGGSTTEVLAYLREKDAEEAARAQARRLKSKGETRVALAFCTAVFSFMAGFFVLITKPLPPPRFPFHVPGYIPAPAPAPESVSHLGVAIAIWSAGLIIIALIAFWGRLGKKKNDGQPQV